jgi:hypothetical protein
MSKRSDPVLDPDLTEEKVPDPKADLIKIASFTSWIPLTDIQASAIKYLYFDSYWRFFWKSNHPVMKPIRIRLLNAERPASKALSKEKVMKSLKSVQLPRITPYNSNVSCLL